MRLRARRQAVEHQAEFDLMLADIVLEAIGRARRKWEAADAAVQR